MGVNIYVYKLKNRKATRVPKSQWDFLRYVGDSAFKFQTEVEYAIMGDEVDDFILSRPKSVKKERKFVNKIADKFSRKRFNYLLDLLEANPTYYVYWSW